MRASNLLILITTLHLAACSGGDSGDNPSSSGAGGSSGSGCETNADCSATPDTPRCDPATGACVALPPGHEIGSKDGSPGSVVFTPVFEPPASSNPADLGFNPENPDELWIVNHLDSSVNIVTRPGQPDATSERRLDPAAAHFMVKPPAIAFGATDPTWGATFGVCGDSDNYDWNPQEPSFMGPALFSARLDVFAKPTPGGLGSHLDMMHDTSYCRGIAHVEANVYFVFNSQLRSIDKYDFHDDHGPGNDIHDDGETFRYVAGAVLGKTGVPSHLVYNPNDAQLYIADTGNHRVAKLDTTSGTLGSGFSGTEPQITRRNVDGAVIVDVVPPGTLDAPSGIEIRNELIYVTDNATSRFYVFDLAGQLIRQLDTGFAPGSLAGFTFGPRDGKIYFVDMISGKAFRIDPRP
jgi:hypothetical protein